MRDPPEVRHDVEFDEAFHSLLESTTAAIIAVDADGRVTVWSRGAERILGWTREEVLGRRLPGVPPEHEALFEDILRRVGEGESIDGLSLVQRREDGSPVDILLSVSPLRDPTGEVRGVLALLGERPDGRVAELASRVQELELRLSELRLRSLQDSLPPHFLLNALHAIAVLMRKGEFPEAVRMLSRLGEILLFVISTAGRSQVPLKEEVAFLEKYLEVERLRFGRELEAEVAVEPEVAEALVPNLLLQPLVENAVRHGIASRPGGGAVRVVASRAGRRLRLEVVDDGRGLPDGFELGGGEGRGLRTTRQRLSELYGSDARFELGERAGGGVRVVVEVPLRLAAAGEEGSPGRGPERGRGNGRGPEGDTS